MVFQIIEMKKCALVVYTLCVHLSFNSVGSASDFPTNVGFREICRISADIEPFCVNWSDFGCNDYNEIVDFHQITETAI